ncbi:hypothetical protein L873DRAFT_1806677 [Choiromyces venosus 120613-1]|uniref:Uncharacterized protein n=1 Tax=Choiromyces venosus 120613-1 TaxID=1336337 RepID=A0A3N4JTJ3_9PEZI|nr:hypothetical protein L873DRAFT_1806677 [Choiromyces venosus 120613-1]
MKFFQQATFHFTLLLFPLLAASTTTLTATTPCTTGTSYTQIPRRPSLPPAHRIPAPFIGEHTVRNLTFPYSVQMPENDNATWIDFLWTCGANCGYNRNPYPCASYFAFYGRWVTGGGGYTCQLLRVRMDESTFEPAPSEEEDMFRAAVGFNRVCDGSGVVRRRRGR